jgi:hypothetical protein
VRDRPRSEHVETHVVPPGHVSIVYSLHVTFDSTAGSEGETLARLHDPIMSQVDELFIAYDEWIALLGSVNLRNGRKVVGVALTREVRHVQ